MSNLKDLIDYPEKSNRLTIVYLLLLANILGMTVFLGQKRDNSVTENNKDFRLTTNQEKNGENIEEKKNVQGDVKDGMCLTNDNKQREVPVEKTDSLLTTLPETPKSNTVINNAQDDAPQLTLKEQHATHKDNVIDFNTISAERKVQEKKEPLKPLVWNFPNESPFLRKH